jgi:hypothetical protein
LKENDSSSTTLTSLYSTLYQQQEAFYKEVKDHNIRIKQLKDAVTKTQQEITLLKTGLDTGKIELARSILELRGSYVKAGQDRASVIVDAIRWFVDGKLCYENGETNYYKDLRRHYFGTKNYDGWHGQRSDHEYGCGPRHGSVIFYVGLQRHMRAANLDSNHVEACIYYLSNIERIHGVEGALTNA